MSARTAFNIPSFNCSVGLSKGLLCLSSLIYCSAIIFVLLTPLDSLLKILSVSVIAGLAWRELRRQLSETLSLNHSLQGWEAVYSQRLCAGVGEGIYLDGKNCLLWPWLVILYAPYQRAVLIPKDSVSDEDFRRIVLRLRANPY